MRTVVVIAGIVNDQAIECKWKGCKKDHYSSGEEYGMRDEGKVKRDKYEGEWYEPYNIMIDSYLNHGEKEGKFEGLQSSRISYLEISESDASHYPTQNHHIIPTSLFETDAFESLAHNLELMGWNINNGLLNGICLPYFKEDYIWHNLQPHRGNHPLKYTSKVENYMSKLNDICELFCSDSNQHKLLVRMNRCVSKIRNGILNWSVKIHREDTLAKWKGEVASGLTKGNYIVDGKKEQAPLLAEPSGRKYFEIDFSS